MRAQRRLAEADQHAEADRREDDVEAETDVVRDLGPGVEQVRGEAGGGEERDGEPTDDSTAECRAPTLDREHEREPGERCGRQRLDEAGHRNEAIGREVVHGEREQRAHRRGHERQGPCRDEIRSQPQRDRGDREEGRRGHEVVAEREREVAPREPHRRHVDAASLVADVDLVADRCGRRPARGVSEERATAAERRPIHARDDPTVQRQARCGPAPARRMECDERSVVPDEEAGKRSSDHRHAAREHAAEQGQRSDHECDRRARSHARRRGRPGSAHAGIGRRRSIVHRA